MSKKRGVPENSYYFGDSSDEEEIKSRNQQYNLLQSIEKIDFDKAAADLNKKCEVSIIVGKSSASESFKKIDSL